jgi:hypothetical protein
MDALHIATTDDTPGVTFDKQQGIFEISGRSLPEDSVEFFHPLFQWLAQYKNEPNPSTQFMFKLEYANTASSKMIQDILSALEKIKGVTIVWYHREDDEDMEDMGHEYSELVDIPFVFKSY